MSQRHACGGVGGYHAFNAHARPLTRARVLPLLRQAVFSLGVCQSLYFARTIYTSDLTVVKCPPLFLLRQVNKIVRFSQFEEFGCSDFPRPVPSVSRGAAACVQ